MTIHVVSSHRKRFTKKKSGSSPAQGKGPLHQSQTRYELALGNLPKSALV